MGGHERLVIHLVDVVAGQQDDRVRVGVLDDVHVAQHGVGGAAIPLGHAPAGDVRLEQLHAAVVAVEVPGPAQPDVVVERAGVVLGQDDDVIDVGVHAVGQREVDDPVLAPERDRGLGPLLRQDREPLAFAAREDHRHRALHGPDPPPDVNGFRVAMLARATRRNLGWGLADGEHPRADGAAATAVHHRNLRGFTKEWFCSTIQWRCGPVAWPVAPS